MNPTLLTCLIIIGSAIVLAGALYGILYLMCVAPPKTGHGCGTCQGLSPCPNYSSGPSPTIEMYGNFETPDDSEVQ